MKLPCYMPPLSVILMFKFADLHLHSSLLCIFILLHKRSFVKLFNKNSKKHKIQVLLLPFIIICPICLFSPADSSKEHKDQVFAPGLKVC